MPRPERRILIVDDDQDLVDVLRMRLLSTGEFRVDTAPDGESGLAECRASPPDAIVMDIALPGIDGWETCRRLRSEPATRSIPVVVMTAWLSESLKARIDEAQPLRILYKPFDGKELADILRGLLEP